MRQIKRAAVVIPCRMQQMAVWGGLERREQNGVPPLLTTSIIPTVCDTPQTPPVVFAADFIASQPAGADSQGSGAAAQLEPKGGVSMKPTSGRQLERCVVGWGPQGGCWCVVCWLTSCLTLAW